MIIFRYQWKRNGLKRGIYTIGDVVGHTRPLLSLEDIEDVYKITTNFLEYGAFSVKIKGYLEWRNKPEYNPVAQKIVSLILFYH